MLGALTRQLWNGIGEAVRWAGRAIRMMASMVILLVVLGALAWQSWMYAERWSEGGTRRLRVFVVNMATLEPGVPLSATQLGFKVAHEADEILDLVTVPSTATGQYVTEKVSAGAALRRSHLSSTPPIAPRAGESVFSILVKPDHGRSLRPGMRLAFVRGSNMIPSAIQLTNESGPRGFLVVAVIPPSGQSGSVTTVLIEAGPCRTARAAPLADGEWVPVVLGP